MQDWHISGVTESWHQNWLVNPKAAEA